MILLEVEIDAEPVRAMDSARALRDELRDLGLAESVDLAREAVGRDPGAKSEGDVLTMAKVVLTLLPVGAQAVVDWLTDYLRRSGVSPVQIKVTREDGASVEAAFNPQTMKREEIVRLAADLKTVLEH